MPSTRVRHQAFRQLKVELAVPGDGDRSLHQARNGDKL